MTDIIGITFVVHLSCVGGKEKETNSPVGREEVIGSEGVIRQVSREINIVISANLQFINGMN